MGKFRHRIGPSRGTKLQRGHINDSNPVKRRHRDAANSARRAELVPLVPVDELEDYGQEGDEKMLDGLNMDSMSLGNPFPSSAASMISEGGMSKMTRYTGFTSCTNQTFAAVHRVWKSGSTLQKEVLAVLSAVAEVIKEKQGNESDVEYFGALLTTLESTPTSEIDRSAATTYLLHLIVKKVSREVLQRNFSETVKILAQALMQMTGDEQDGVACKFLIMTLGVVLRAQPSTVWLIQGNRDLVMLIASFCTHSKPRVRTVARRVVRGLLTDPVSAVDNGLHAAAGQVGEYVDEQIRACLDSKQDSADLIRYFCLLEGIMHKMPARIFKQLAEGILKSVALANSQVKCAALQCLYRALLQQPSEAALSVEINALLISSLRSLAPSPSDAPVCAFWLQALVEAHVCLTCKDKRRSCELMPETLEEITKAFQVANNELCQVIVQVLNRVIERCIEDETEAARKLLALLEASLTGFSATIWKYIFKSMTYLFQIAGPALCADELVRTLRTLARLREEDGCSCKQEIDFAIGAAVRYIGVQHVVQVLPLQIDPDAPVLPLDFRRSWLLPVFRVNIRNAPLEIFIKYFMPLATKLYRRLDSLEKVTAKAYHIIQAQLWDLLPAFTGSASDFETGFPHIAQMLGVALNERKDLRSTLLTGIRSALSIRLGAGCTGKSTRSNVKVIFARIRDAELFRFAKNYLPILFNMYVNDGEVDDGHEAQAVRLSALSAIQAYVEAAPQELLAQYTRSAIQRFDASREVSMDASDVEKKKEQHKQKDVRKRIVDIMIAMVKTASPAEIQEIFALVTPFFDKPKDGPMQKKAYRVLVEVLKRRCEPDVAQLFADDQQRLLATLLKSSDAVAGPARSSHQEAVDAVLSSTDSYVELQQFVQAALPLTVQCLEKSNSMPTRESASKCFQHMCLRLIERGAEEDKRPTEVLYTVINAIYALLTPKAGQPAISLETTRACLVALNIIAQKHIKLLDGSNLARLVAQGCTAIADSRPTVRVLGIRLVRILVVKMPPEIALHQHREPILQAFFAQDCDTATTQIRKANKILLDVVLDKFGQMVVEKYATDRIDWQKQIKALAKAKRRKARKAEGGEDENDSGDDDGRSVAGSQVSAKTAGADTILQLLEDSDEEDEVDKEEMMERRSRTGSVWLREDADEVNDLLDRNMLLNKVSTVDPSLVAKREARMAARKKDKCGFAVTKDGKLIIDDESDDEKPKKKKKTENVNSDDIADVIGSKKGSTKSRKAGSDDESDDNEEEDDKKSRVSRVSRVSGVSRKSTTSGYKPGGTGIHRDLTRPIAKAARRQNKAGGDVKAKGKALEPYAYVPLKKLGKKGAAGAAQEEIRRMTGRKRKMRK
ncbi:unnamed protein product, partial [Mesorhabditis spiculigera]